jgi:DNA polymerase alpha-associated DNA helicase A
MNSQIAKFPSKVMYSGKLRSHDSVRSHLLNDLPNTSADGEEEEKEALGTPVVFYDTAGCEYFERLEGDGDEGSRCNENEAMVVKGWLERLVSCFCDFVAVRLQLDIGLVWGFSGSDCNYNTVRPFRAEWKCDLFEQFRRYQAQVTLLTSLLRPIYGLELEIGTVDGMQGREKDAVVISLVRSNEKVYSSYPILLTYFVELTISF